MPSFAKFFTNVKHGVFTSKYQHLIFNEQFFRSWLTACFDMALRLQLSKWIFFSLDLPVSFRPVQESLINQVTRCLLRGQRYLVNYTLYIRVSQAVVVGAVHRAYVWPGRVDLPLLWHASCCWPIVYIVCRMCCFWSVLCVYRAVHVSLYIIVVWYRHIPY